jgi:hypothetical protein
VECPTNHKIKVLRSNNNGEYKSNKFNAHCLKFGIKKDFTTPYTPQQNGVFYHKNRILLDVTLAMLSHVSLSKVFLGETLLITNYLQNQSPTKVVSNNITPYEIWFGHKPILSHLQFFGCKGLCPYPKI